MFIAANLKLHILQDVKQSAFRCNKQVWMGHWHWHVSWTILSAWCFDPAWSGWSTIVFLILLRFSQRPWHPTESTHLREDFLLLPPLAWYYCCPSLLQVELDLLNLSRDLASLRVLDPPTMAGQINDQKISKTSSGRWLVSQVSSAGRLALWNCWAARASSAACPKTPDCGEEATSSPEEDAAGEGLKNGELMAWFMVN